MLGKQTNDDIDDHNFRYDESSLEVDQSRNQGDSNKDAPLVKQNLWPISNDDDDAFHRI